MAAVEATKSNGSAESYIGSFISLTSKSEIRYEGFLFHLNPTESTIGLRNVKSFGTEGRKKDGAQILPSDKVYDYIFFRGTDIQDLQVISSPPVLTTTAVPDDPAIIQSHFPQSTTWSSSAPPPTANGNGLVPPAYWPGSRGSSGGVPHLPQQSFVRPQDFAIPPLVQQQMQYPSMNASIPDNTPKLPEFSLPVLPTLYSGSLNLPFTVPPQSALPSNLPIGQSTNVSTDFSSVVLSSSSPLVLPLTPSSLGFNPAVTPIAERPFLSIIGSSSTTHSEAAIPPLVTPAQLLQPGSKPGAKTPPSIHSLQIGHKDIEVVQAKKSELLSPDSENSLEPGPHLPSPPAKKLNGGSLCSPPRNRHQAQGRENKLNGATIHTHRINRDRPQGRGNALNGAALYTHHDHRGHARGRGNGLNGAALHSHYSNRRHSWGRENAPNGVALQDHFRYSSHQRGRGAQVMPKMTKFTEEFDFEAMNEKFNKKEVWGQLGKSYESGLDDKEGDRIDHGEEDEAGSPKSDLKPVYVKDDFFDSFSCNTLNHESGRGRPKLSEQMKMDTETFGEFRRNRRGPGRGSQGRGHGGQLRGSYRGRGYGYAGRGRGGTVWSRVT